MNILSILLYAHSGIRWLIILVALLALVIFGYGWLGKKNFSKLERILPASYSFLLDAQVLLGAVFMVLEGIQGAGFPRYRLEHFGVMVLAALAAHLPTKMKKAEKENYQRNVFLSVLFSLVLIYLGIAALPGGLNR